MLIASTEYAIIYRSFLAVCVDNSFGEGKKIDPDYI